MTAPLPLWTSLLDSAVDEALAAARNATGIDLPGSVHFVWCERNGMQPRRVDREDVPGLLAATAIPSGKLVARTEVSVAGVHEGHAIVLLQAGPMAAEPARPFVIGGVRLPRSRRGADGRIAWDSAWTWAELEAAGRETLDECAEPTRT